MRQACVGALHRADRRRAPDVNRLRINLHMRIAPGRRTTRTNRKPNPRQTRARALHRANGRRAPIASQTRACALHRANRRRAANASQLRINPHMRVAPSRQEARTRRKSTLHQFAHVRCTEPIRGAHQTQVNPASNPRTRVALSRHAAHTKRKSTPSQPAHARCTEPTGGALNVSRLRFNLHMCIAPSRHATHTKRKSTPSQPAHACGTEPIGDPH